MMATSEPERSLFLARLDARNRACSITPHDGRDVPLAPARNLEGTNVRNVIGGLLSTLGWVIGGINYLVTAGWFFANDQFALGFIQLVVPPAELVLPWLAGAAFGVASAVSFGLLILGGAISQ
ncbi:MAG: hypothetical protein ACO23O_04565 [Ilumatobacteraceae bacterium]